MMRGWKSGRIEKIWFSFMCVWLGGWKSGGMKNSFVLVEKKNERINCSFYEFTLMPLLRKKIAVII